MSLLDNLAGALSGAGGVNLEQLATQLGGGGLNTILEKFNEAGLGEIVQSWVGTGANLPIEGHQLQGVLGADAVSKLSSALGIQSSGLASVLPNLIDQLTPNGALPSSDISNLLSQAISSGVLNNLLGSLFK